ncbi:hypothetical protein BaRGS_00034063 [Batillaria attramentaria]|uniref:Uncharacterized protein n=1 Tax=Batillaria attramentaria TaxID=370345 RepID=A0ABD0JIA5_9CAEN
MPYIKHDASESVHFALLSDDVSKFQDDDVSRKVVGTGDPAECERVLTQVLDPVGGLCSPTPCSIRDRYQPAVGSMGFYGISAFLYAPNNLGAIEDDQTLNITKLRRNAWKHCNRSLEQFKAESDGKADFASNDCLLGLFIPLLLTRSLGIPEDSTAVKLAKQIEGERVDWALGAMLQELSMAFMDDLETSINCRPGNTPVTPVTRKASGGSQPLRLSLTCLGPLLIVMLAVQNCL